MNLLIALVPLSYHCWRHETLKQVDDGRRVLALLKQEVGGCPQDSIELCRCGGAQGLLAWLLA